MMCRFVLLAAAFLFRAATVAAFESIAGNFTLRNAWNETTVLSGAIESNLGGLFFDKNDGNVIYIVSKSEYSDSALYRTTVSRDPSTGVITDIDFAGAVLHFNGTETGLSAGFEYGPNGTLFYTYWDDNLLGQRPGFTASDPGTESLFDFGMLNLTGDSIAGLAFSPHIMDPVTNFGMLQVYFQNGSPPQQVYNVPLRPKPNSPGVFEPDLPNRPPELLFSITEVNGTEINYSAGAQYIPSGSFTGNLLVNSWEDDLVLFVDIDTSSGYAIDKNTDTATLGTTDPYTEILAQDLSSAYGIEFDPQTNDLLVSSWSGFGGVQQIRGFPPGVNIAYVSAALADIAADIATLFLPNRQLLRKRRAQDNGATIDVDRYWVPTLPDPIKCKDFGSEHNIHLGKDEKYACLTVGEGICQDNDGGRFGTWKFGIDKEDNKVKLWDPSTNVVYENFEGATHICIVDEEMIDENDPDAALPKPGIFTGMIIYDEKRQMNLASLSCRVRPTNERTQLKLVDHSKLGDYVDYEVAVLKFRKGPTPDKDDDNSLWNITVAPPPQGNSPLIGTIQFNDDWCEWEDPLAPSSAPSSMPSSMPTGKFDNLPDVNTDPVDASKRVIEVVLAVLDDLPDFNGNNVVDTSQVEIAVSLATETFTALTDSNSQALQNVPIANRAAINERAQEALEIISQIIF